MNIIQSLLDLDLSLLNEARYLVDPKYATIIQLLGEFVVLYGAVFLVSLWLYGTFQKDYKYKRIALSVFYTIVLVFLVYAVINLGIPKWRLGAMEIPGAIAPLIPHPIDNSFPSGHALFTIAFLVGVYRYFYKIQLLLFIGAIGVVTLVSRVIGGVHYPGDIIGGLIIGGITAYFLKDIVDFLVLKTSPIIIKIASWFKL
ncbi:phosphatase PAP2 family protein [Candidatus Gracilibacteria bacterium]|nr:phosphatase PAP2 family protein [Candidatus Gracilibacteria bacterium]